MRPLLAAASFASFAALAVACASHTEESDDSADAITKPGETSPAWLYEGPMPTLESPEIVTSIVGHTLRVTGLLPRTYDTSKLPWYAVTERVADRTRVHVVYPVATGKMIDGKWNNVPGSYDHLNVRPFRPNDPAQLGKEHWGGFPFLNYHDARRFAMHGPIDFTEDFPGATPGAQDWRLVRGRISAGCQRMQGEHVLELTNMLGFDMSKPWTTATNKPDPKNKVEGKWIPIKMTVLDEPQYDTFEGTIVDVDYPKDPSVPALPEGKPVKVFGTWDANEMRAWACPVAKADDPNRTPQVKRTDARFNGTYCARTHGANTASPASGGAL
ncbi:hypothetical protein AKJ09_04018 [Labilithrix luteola]|uniref:YkuD domain-containing protein n=1 Tax=Labilithrix luteola TaxID=1391654 RepID=A0A0K1PW38_9BACT|nr:hypothetical protein [Labilithrix luteola]AKU97354.1 hypothetical protein AKJ09_04018 [Labilithrix luteola]